MKRALLLSLACLAFAVPAHAQIPAGIEALTLTLAPQYPRPYETVTVTVNSTLVDLFASTVTVRANGEVIEEGSGTLSAQILLGGPGTRTVITATAVQSGVVHTAELAVRPADVALVLEPQSTTHPFYKGGSLVAPEGDVRLVAVPDIRTSPAVAVPANQLVYTWRFGNRILEAESGIGRSVLSATAPVRYRDADITLTVSTQDYTHSAQASVRVSPVDSLVRLYRFDPLLGTDYTRALTGTYTLGATEETLRAIGYFFAAPPSIAWAVGSVTSSEERDITVRATGNGQGTARLTATARGASALQFAETPLSVRFGETQGFNLFGL